MKTAKVKPKKPAKPRPDFPLYAHASGKWGKTIRGKAYYFGSWDDPEGALAEYLDQADDLHAGRTPRAKQDLITVGQLCNEFLHHCRAKVKSGEMVERTLTDYVNTTDRIVRVFRKGKVVEALRPSDFGKLRADISKTRGPVALTNEIGRIRRMFNFGIKSLLLESPPKYGESFDRPSKKSIQQARAKNGKKLFTSAECCSLLDNARTPELRALILLGLNCGLGNSDCAKLPLDALWLDSGWLDYPRPKTGIDRRCPLWSETVEALKEVLARREQREGLAIRKRGGETNMVFLTKYGRSYDRQSTSITNEFAKLLEDLNMKKPGRGFYSLRHTFRTIADSTRDFPSCRAIMGHCDDSMDAVYAETIDDDRLRAVVNHVHSWLFSTE